MATLGVVVGSGVTLVRRLQRSAATLAEAGTRLRVLIEHVPAAVYIDTADPDVTDGGRLAYMSPQVTGILGYRPEEVVDDPELWPSRIHPDDREAAIAAYEAHWQTGQPLQAEYRMLARDGSEVWVSSEIGGTVSIIDPVKHEVKKKITFDIPGLRKEAIQAVGISITRDGKTGFVALGPANRIAVINAATHEVQKYLLVGQRVWHMAFTPDEKYLLTTNGVSNDISMIDVANLKVTKTIQVGELPWGIAISQQ
jgi:PAS domain S-box-containing protein